VTAAADIQARQDTVGTQPCADLGRNRMQRSYWSVAAYRFTRMNPSSSVPTSQRMRVLR